MILDLGIDTPTQITKLSECVINQRLDRIEKECIIPKLELMSRIYTKHNFLTVNDTNYVLFLYPLYMDELLKSIPLTKVTHSTIVMEPEYPNARFCKMNVERDAVQFVSDFNFWVHYTSSIS